MIKRIVAAAAVTVIAFLSQTAPAWAGPEEGNSWLVTFIQDAGVRIGHG